MNKLVENADSSAEIIKNPESHALLHEMIRSFTTLARTLNLSHAVAELNSTRQTVRRHITQLEEAKGERLFVLEDRQYRLTDAGVRALPEAEEILARGNLWLQGNLDHIDGLQWLHSSMPDGWKYYQQQQPIGKAFNSSGRLLPDCILAWSEAGGNIEHPAMQAVRPKCMIFRRSEGRWLFTEVGEESSFPSWFGWAAARSSVGRELGQLPGGPDFDRLVNAAYTEIEQTQSLRLDHCYGTLHNEEIGGLAPICFERLLLGSHFADGSFAMVSAVRRTYDVEIRGVDHKMLRLMPEKYLM